jgi:hypothetical protein
LQLAVSGKVFAYNRGMNHLDILLPFGLPQAEMARELLRQCKAPTLATLLGRGKHLAPATAYDPFSRALPHEHWLSEQFGLTATGPDSSDQRGNSPAAAVALLQRHDPAQQQGHWFILQPAHIHVARDHLVLADLDHLALAEADARRLFASAQALFTELGRTLVYVSATTWLMRADDWAGLRTATPQAASGHNIDIWMPSGPGEQAWRKLQNEVQMQWFSEALNEERERRGQQAINSLWLWGGGDAASAGKNTSYDHRFNLRLWSQTLSSSSACGPNDILSTPGERGLLLLDALLESGLTNEWGMWLQHMETLEREWFAPLLQALPAKRLHSLRLVLSGQDRLLQVNVTPATLRKFWARPSLSLLLPE